MYSMTLKAPIKEAMFNESNTMSNVWVKYFDRLMASESFSGDDLEFGSLTLGNLTTNRLIASDGDKALVSVGDLKAWIAGNANQITVTDDGDGTITLSFPSNLIFPGTTTTTGDATFSAGLISSARLIVKTVKVTTTYTILSSDHVVFCDTDGGSFTATLPVGVEGQEFKIINCGSNTLTVDPDGTEELFGAGAGVASSLASGEIIDIHYNATKGWF
ncbi:MAG: hypothetical protein GY714_20270 [Desulfobacterales bacterium]|nr:hypothetical protein [Desulfobacterales bacterium]